MIRNQYLDSQKLALFYGKYFHKINGVKKSSALALRVVVLVAVLKRVLLLYC